MSDVATLDRPRQRPSRATGQRENVVEVTFFDAELRLLDALLARRGKSRGRATLLRGLLLRELKAAGIEDPGAAESEVTAA